MSSRTLVTLLITLAVLVALAIAVSFSQRSGSASGQLLLPGLKEQLNDIDRIVVRSAGAKTVATLVRREGGWVLSERDDYAADMGRIRKNLIALAEARILEEKTSSPELYNRIGVDDIDKETAGGTLLELSAGSEAQSIIIGNAGVGGGERAYARRSGEATSWLVSGAFDLPRETSQWLDRSVTDIEPTRVQTVTIRHPDGGTVKVGKGAPDTADFIVTGVPAGRELSFDTVGNAIGAALSDLTLDNVAPAAGFDPGEVEPIVARFETVDGLVVEARTWKLPSGNRVRFSASTAPTEEGKDTAAIEAEAARLNARLGDWVYTLPEFKGEQLTRKLQDLLQPLPPGK